MHKRLFQFRKSRFENTVYIRAASKPSVSKYSRTGPELIFCSNMPKVIPPASSAPSLLNRVRSFLGQAFQCGRTSLLSGFGCCAYRYRLPTLDLHCWWEVFLVDEALSLQILFQEWALQHAKTRRQAKGKSQCQASAGATPCCLACSAQLWRGPSAPTLLLTGRRLLSPGAWKTN